MPSLHSFGLPRALGRRASHVLLSALTLLSCPLQAQERPALQVAVSRALAPPFVIWRDNQAQGGVDVDIAQALAAQLKTRVEFQVLPRPRVEAALQSGEADIACNLSPLLSPRGEALPQSQGLFELYEMVAGHPAAPAADHIDQLPAGSTMGTLQGQAYPLLEPLFNQGRLKRDDALDDERMLRKLTRERHPYGISSPQSLAWFARQDGEGRIASWRLPLGSRPYRCTFSPRGRFEVLQLSGALDQLLNSGRIEHILASHGAQTLAVVVSTRSPLYDISRSALTELFLGLRSHLTDQLRSEPVISSGPERQLFFSVVLQREAAQYRAAWAAQQFGGRRRAPLELSNAEAMKSYLQRNAQAIGFLPLHLVDSSLRIIYLP